MTKEELEQIFEVCPTFDWREYISLCRLTGLRSGEALILDRMQVDLDKARLTIHAKKTGNPIEHLGDLNVQTLQS